MRAALNFLLALFVAASAQAAEITIIRDKDPKIVPNIFVKGELVEGDALEFERKIKGLTRGLVVLSSPGGDVSEGLSIAAAVRTQGLATSTIDKCASACAFIWLAGVRRYFSEGARIGFHAAYSIVDGKPAESGMGNADIGAFLAHLGLSREAIRFITSAPPDGMRWITLEDARRLNISVSVGPSMVDPSGKQYPPLFEASPAKPDAERNQMYVLANGFADFLEAQECSKIFRVNVKNAQQGKEEMMEMAKEKHADRFLPILQEVLNLRVTNRRQDGDRRACEQNRARLEEAGIRDIYLD